MFKLILRNLSVKAKGNLFLLLLLSGRRYMDSGGGIVHGEERKKNSLFLRHFKLNFEKCPTDEDFESFQFPD